MNKFAFVSLAKASFSRLTLVGAVLAAFVCLATTARADSTINGSVWENATSYPNTFPSTAPAGTATATFTVSHSGGNDFSFTSSTDNGLTAFLTSGGDTLKYLTGASAAGDSINNDVFQFTGTTYLTAGTTYTITHDDGMYLFLTGNGLNNYEEINSGAPTSADGSSFLVTTSGYYSFDLLYAEVNGAPAELSGNLGNITATPEPSSLLLMGSGLLGMAMLVFWKGKASRLALHS
jgi:hypothetical protein